MADEDQVEQQALYNELLKQELQLESQKSSILQSQFDIMNSMFNINSQSVDSQTQSVGNLEDAMESLTKTQNKANKSLDSQSDELKSVFGETNKVTGAMKKLGATLNTIIPLGAGFATFAKTIQFAGTAAGSLLDVVGTLSASFFRLGVSLFTLPLGIINDLFAEAQKFGSNEFRRQLEETRKQFGDLGKFESKAIIDGFRNIRGAVAETGLSSYRIFGNMAERLQFVRESAMAMGVAFSLLQTQVAQNAERLGAYTKGLGLTEEGQKALANRAVATGQSLTEIGRQITTYAYQVGNAFGFNGKLISRDVGTMLGDIENFGNLSVQTLTNVAVYARRLGVEVKALTKVVGAFDDFDKAAESVGRLSQAFGLQLDTFALVQEQDPAARIEQLRKSFFAAGKSIESMTRQERSLLATHTGLDQETLALVFSQKSQGKSYEEIQRKSEQARKHQLTQAEAMEKLSNSIERLVKDGQALQGGLFDILFSGFASGVRRSAPFRQLMRDIRHLMREIFQVGRSMGKMFIEIFPGIREVFGGLGDFLSPSGIGRNFQNLKAQFREFLTGLTPETAGRKIQEFIKSVTQNFTTGLSGEGLSKIKQGLTTIAAVVSQLLKGLIISIGNNLSEMMMLGAQALRNPDGILNAIKGGAGQAQSGLMAAFGPILEGIVQAAPVVAKALGELFDAAWDLLMPKLVNFAKEHWVAIGAVLFGPAVVSAALSAVATSLVGAISSGLGGIIAKGLSKTAANIPANAGGGGLAKAIQSVDGAAEALDKSKALTKPSVIGKALIAVGAITIIGGALALGMYGLVKAFSGVSPAQIGTASLAMVAAASVAGLVGLAVVGLGTLGATLTGPQALLVAAGVAGVGLVGAALAAGMLQLIKAFSGVDAASVQKVGDVMTTAMMVVGEIAASAVVLGGVGLLSAAAPVVAVGMVGLALIAKGLSKTFASVIASMNSLDLGSLMLINVKFNAIFTSVKNIASIVGLIVTATLGMAAASVPMAAAAAGSVLLFASIKTLANNMVDSVSGLIKNLNTLPGGNDVRQKTEVFTSIIQAIVGFGSTVKDMLDTGGTFDGIGNTARSINSVMAHLTSQIANTVKNFMEEANKIGSVDAIRPKLDVITGILTAISTFAHTLTSTNVTDEDSIEALQNFSSSMFRSLNSFVENSLPQITTLIQTISQAATGNINVEAVKALGTVIDSVLGGFGNIVVRLANSLTREGGLLKDADSLKAVGPTLGRAIGAITASLSGPTGLFSSLNLFVTDLLKSFSEVSEGDIQKLTAVGGLLGPLFQAIGAIANTAATLGQNAITGGPDAFKKLQDVIGAVSAGITGEFSKLISNLVTTFGSIDRKSVSAIASVTPVLNNLFTTIKQVFTTIGEFGSAAGGNENATKVQNAFRNVYEGLFGNSASGWSLKGFIDSINGGAGQALLNSIESGKGGFASLGQKIGEFKRNITSVFGGTDTTFATNINAGLNSTLSHINATITEIVDKINDVHRQINEVGRSININAALSNLGETIGTANPERLQIARGDLTININVNVKLDVDDIEEAIATRANGSSFVVSRNAEAQRTHLKGAYPLGGS